jgi:hypothetical protein
VLLGGSSGQGRVQRGRGRAGEGGGRRVGRSNYTVDELNILLESVRHILPISGREWEEVVTRHILLRRELPNWRSAEEKIQQVSQDSNPHR